MHSGVIVLKQKGFLVPETYLDLVSAKYPSCVGVAIYDDGNLMTQRIDCGGKPTDALARVKVAQDKFRANIMVFHFGNFPSGFHPDNIQPFDLIVNDKSEPLIAGFMEGDFIQFEEPKSTKSQSYNLAEGHLKPMLLEMYNDNSRELFDNLDKPTVRRNIMLTSSTHGVVVLVSSEDTLSFIKDPNSMRRDWVWGWTSNHLGFEEKGVAAKALNKLQDALNSIVPAAAPAPAKVELEFPPSTIGKNDHSGLKKWYEKRVGYVPTNYKERPGVPKKQTTIVKSLEDLPKPDVTVPKPAAAPEPAAKPSGVPAPAKAPAPAKPATTPISSPEPEPPAEEGEADLIPIMPTGMREAIQKFLKEDEVKKVIDRHSQEMLDPKIIQGLEDKRPSFTEQTGIQGGLDETFKWPYEVLLELCRRTPEAAAILMMDYRALVAPVVKKATAPMAASVPAAAPARRSII